MVIGRHGLSQSRDVLRALRRLPNIYGDCAISVDIQEKKSFLLLDRGSQSYLSWFIVSLVWGVDGAGLFYCW